jgi:hypothetical protein
MRLRTIGGRSGLPSTWPARENSLDPVWNSARRLNLPEGPPADVCARERAPPPLPLDPFGTPPWLRACGTGRMPAGWVYAGCRVGCVFGREAAAGRLARPLALPLFLSPMPLVWRAVRSPARPTSPLSGLVSALAGCYLPPLLLPCCLSQSVPHCTDAASTPSPSSPSDVSHSLCLLIPPSDPHSLLSRPASRHRPPSIRPPTLSLHLSLRRGGSSCS